MNGKFAGSICVMSVLGLGVPAAVMGQTIPQGQPAARGRAANLRPANARPANGPATPAGPNDITAPRLADLSPQSLAYQPVSPPRGAVGQPAGMIAAPAPVQHPGGNAGQFAQPGAAGQGGKLGQILTAGPIAANLVTPPVPNATAPPAAPNNAVAGAPSQVAGAMPEGQGQGAHVAGGAIVGGVLQPNILTPPTNFAPPGQMLPVLSLDNATILGGIAQPLAAPAPLGVPTGLVDDTLTPVPSGQLGLTSLAWDDKTSRLADLSPQIIPYGPPGPEAALGGFVPFRILPWPGLPIRTAAATVPPQQPALATGYNPLASHYGLGLAMNSFAQIGSQLGAGLGSIGMLPGLPPIPH
jgi:hypothetical protein